MSSLQTDKNADLSVLDIKSTQASQVCDKNTSPLYLEDDRSQTSRSKSATSSLETDPASPLLSSPNNEKNQQPTQIFIEIHASLSPSSTLSSMSARISFCKVLDEALFRFDNNQHAGKTFTLGLEERKYQL